MSWLPGILAMLIGLMAAAGELLPRYRDEPGKAIASFAGVCYLLVNSLLSLLAYALLTYTTQDAGDTSWTHVQNALIGGLGAVVIFRAKFFSVKIGDVERSIGPGNLIDAVLAYLDRQIDRVRALTRATLVKESMKDVDFDKAKMYVLLMITGGMQNLSSKEQEELGQRIGEIEASTMSPREKSYGLGFLILDFMGDQALHKMFDGTHGDYGANAPPTPPPPVQPPKPAPPAPAPPAPTPPAEL